MKKILLSLGMILFVGVVVAGATGAFFSDTETSTGNTFTAGAIDLTVDSEQHYNGNECIDSLWVGYSPYPVAGTACDGTWLATDLGAETFFNFGDVKPGDFGENTISLHVDSNDAWACVDVEITQNDDVSSTEPELEVDAEEDTGDAFDGELAQNIYFTAWADDGDNVWEAGEPLLFSNGFGPASDVLGGKSYTLAAPGMDPLPGDQTTYIGLAWCAGEMTLDENNNEIGCSGAGMGNITQTDSMQASIAFRVEQSRNNGDFVCEASAPEPTRYISSVQNYSQTGWAGWSCPINEYAVGGGVIENGSPMGAEGIAETGATIGGSTYPTFPHHTFGAGETGYVAQNGGTAQTAKIFVDCLPKP